ncbi:MAG: hypothetical protein HPY58_09535 [Firmicutes bacterium]|nr:hypothetical protein [Bacillota bacterium]
MSQVVDKWVEKCINLPQIGEMTHTERMRKAFELEDPDMVPVAIETDEWQIIYAGYDFYETWDDVDKVTDAVLKTWHDLRQDVIWPYFCPSHVLDPLLTPEQRKSCYDLRDGKSYVVFREVTKSLDEMIKVYESKPWQKYGLGRLATHYLPHFDHMLEFQKKMNNTVPTILGIPNPSNLAEWAVGVENFLRWTVSEPKSKVHYYLELVTEYLLGSLEACRPYAEAGIEFICVFGGARTWGPRQFEEFGIYDRIFAEKCASIFKYPFHHICGHNLPYAMEMLASMPYAGVQYDEPMKQLGWSWAQWCEWVARLNKGIACVMNAPTTQALAYKDAEYNRTMIKEFIEHTTPHTTAVIMPGCEISVGTPLENVKAAIEATRKYGKYPECKTAAEQIWTEESFQESRKKLTKNLPQWALHYRKNPRTLK